MADYTGYTCFHCQKPFQLDDDIVVCPDCGTPYHRGCWKETGHCTNLNLHETGGSWKQTQPEPEPKQSEQRDTMTAHCPRCGTAYPEGQPFCTHCGMILQDAEESDSSSYAWQNGASAPMDACCGLDPEEQYEGERLEDIANFVQNNTLYYIPLFKKFRETGSKLSMNLISALVPPLYFANRKMWGMVFLLLAGFMVLEIPTQLYTMLIDSDMLISSLRTVQDSMGSFYTNVFESMIQQMKAFCTALQPYENLLYWLHTICTYLNFAVRILLFAFSNYIYYRFVLRRVRQIRELHLPATAQRDRLRMQGGTNGWFIVLAFLADYGVSLLFSMILVTFIGVFF